jgi:hypothetical protein
LHFGLPILATLLAPVLVAAEVSQAANCIDQVVTFDGITPLAYATVKASQDQRVYLSPKHPSQCAEPVGNACTSNAYLVAGDRVAVAKQCDGSSYIQFIGPQRITTGWVSASSLSLVPTRLPFDAGTPPDQSNAFIPTTVKMHLTRGVGIPVCEAYLQRLNQTVFHEPPYCGRPENDQVPGFYKLNRVPIPPEQFRELYGHLTLFSETGNSGGEQDVTRMYDREPHGDVGEDGAWEYDPEVDIENNGTGTPFVVWGAMPTFPACGDRHRQTGPGFAAQGARGSQLLFVLKRNGAEIDDRRTKELFWHPLEPNIAGLKARQVGSSMSVFRYRNQYYWDTFFDGNGWPDFDGKRKKDKSLPAHLAVFLRQQGRTRQMCEYVYDESSAKPRSDPTATIP